MFSWVVVRLWKNTFVSSSISRLKNVYGYTFQNVYDGIHQSSETNEHLRQSSDFILIFLGLMTENDPSKSENMCQCRVNHRQTCISNVYCVHNPVCDWERRLLACLKRLSIGKKRKHVSPPPQCNLVENVFYFTFFLQSPCIEVTKPTITILNHCRVTSNRDIYVQMTNVLPCKYTVYSLMAGRDYSLIQRQLTANKFR